jgi:hypothetical protein
LKINPSRIRRGDAKMRKPYRLLAVVAVSIAAGSPGAIGAEGWPAADRPIAEVVDRYVDAGLAKAGVKAAPEADDATLVRRLTLDLAGRVPTAA